MFAQPVLAQQETRDEATEADTPTDDFHDRRIDQKGEIVVTAIGVSQLDVLAGTSVVEGVELQRNLEAQIGDVLVDLPGVSATSFSPGASRPVLRGFQGERVRVLVDGIGSIDVSNTSADHATTIDPLTAESIEVLRGPAVLLYGSQAIGGAVNVIDKRIPQRMLKEPFHIDATASADTAYDLREGGASLDVPLGSHFVVHADGSYRDTNDVEIAGFAASPPLRADLLADATEEEDEGHLDEADELRELANQRGILPSSATRTWTTNLGFAFFEGESDLGASIGWYDSDYGVPTRPGTGHHHEDGGAVEEEEGEESVSIGLKQFRADLRGRLALGDGFFKSLNTRVGYSDYTHTEFEGEEVGTVFDVQGIEARAVLEQNPRGGWMGSIGTQYYFRDFDANGAEAYVPKNRTNQFAVFALQELDLGAVELEGAGRFEKQRVESQVLGFDRSFNTFSAALGIAHETEDGLRFGINGSRAERAPSAEEMLSNGPHIATQAFEVGDPNLSTESAWGVEAFVRGRLGPASLSFAAYKNWFQDYIYLVDTGVEEDDLPVFNYLQQDADWFGLEGQVYLTLFDSSDLTIATDLRGDYIRAELADGSPLPRIPPVSLLGALEAQTSRLDGRIEVQWNDGQDRVADFETPTDSFTFVNASLAWKPFVGDENLTVMFQVDNIFDTVGRRHASFTKDYVPLAGRNFKLSLRASI
jgi:iron complex outermembrane receptor protein